MANRYATKSGNWSDPTVWDGGVLLPQSGDTVRPNNFTVTIDQDITVSELRNDASSPAVSGGVFLVSSSRTIVANCTFTTNASSGIQFTSGVSNVTGSLSGGGGSGWPLNISGSTVNWTGNFSHTHNLNFGLLSSGTLNLTGNFSATANGTNCNGFAVSGGVVTVTGNVTATSGTGAAGVYVITKTAGTLTITGNVTGAGGAAVWNSSGQLTVNGNVYAGSSSAAIWCYSSGMTNVYPNQPAAGPTFVLSGSIFDHSNGTPAVICGSMLINSSSAMQFEKRTNSSGTPGFARSLYTGGTNLGQPSISNVRSGTVFGASSEYTGTLAVPSPTLVAIGVPTDNTVGSYAPAGGLDAGDLHDALDSYANKADWKATGFATPANLPADFETLTITDGKVAVELDTVLETAISSAAADAATLVSRLTSGRAANLDNLDVAVSVVQAQITALNNLSAKANWFGSLLLEVPDSGTRDYVFELVVKDDEDKLVNLDASPTIALVNAAGADRSSLITTGIANPSTGRFTITITVGAGTTNESLKLTASGTVSGEARYAVIAPQVVDYDNATQIALLLTRIGAPSVSVSADISALNTKIGTPANSSIADDISRINGGTASAPDLLLDTTVSAVSDLRTFTLSQGSPDDGCYLEQLVIISDVATANQKARVLVSAYDAGDKLLTVDRDPVFSIAVGDRVVIVAIGERSSIVSGFTADGRAQLGAALTAAYDDGTLEPSTCIPVVSGSDWRIDFTNIGTLTGRTNLIFAIKNRSNDSDSASLILVDTTTGLKFVNGAAYGTPGNASIVVTDETVGTGYVLVKSAATINLPSGQKYAGLKLVKSTGDIRVSEPWRPCLTILDGIVDANS